MQYVFGYISFNHGFSDFKDNMLSVDHVMVVLVLWHCFARMVEMFEDNNGVIRSS
jgi:hypothetical protein